MIFKLPKLGTGGLTMDNGRLNRAAKALSVITELSAGILREYSNAAQVILRDYGEGITRDGVGKAIRRNRKNKNRGRKRG